MDEGAARARWQTVRFVEALDTVHQLDRGEKDMLLALAGTQAGRVPVGIAASEAPEASRQGVDFARELFAWIDRFHLAGHVMELDRPHLAGAPGGYHDFCPVGAMRDMPPILKGLEPSRRLAAIALLSLYNGQEARAAFKSKRLAAMNPPAVEAFTTLREGAGEEAHAHLLRLLAAYQGW